MCIRDSNYALVQFVSLSTWKQIEKTIGNAEPDTYIRILSEKERTLTELSMIETELTNVLGHDISFEVENRVQEKIDNDAMLNGYKLIIGALCVLLAFIGIANVFSNTLGFIRQRKREFARYMSCLLYTSQPLRFGFRLHLEQTVKVLQRGRRTLVAVADIRQIHLFCAATEDGLFFRRHHAVTDAVSYTHLDVYKRQVGVGGIGGKKDAIGRAGHKGHKADDIFFAFMKECRYNRAISLKREGFSYGLVHQRRRI